MLVLGPPRFRRRWDETGLGFLKDGSSGVEMVDGVDYEGLYEWLGVKRKCQDVGCCFGELCGDAENVF